MKKFILATSILFLTVFATNAQSYDTGIGLRGGLYNGLTIKHFVSEQAAVEGILSTRWGGFNITGLYEMHKIAFDTPGLYWFYGFGGHIGFWDGDNNPWFEDNQNYTVFGIDGIIGMEYVFEDIPFTLGVDWKPAINLAGNSNFLADGGALSIRYIF
jgi:hypothetical protein